jgi:hypothetical protein
MSVHPNAALEYPNVLLNRERWPAIQVGDIIELTVSHMKEPCVFVIDQNDPVGLPPNLQVCHGNAPLGIKHSQNSPGICFEGYCQMFWFI